MAVLQSPLWEVAPGRRQELIGHAAHSKKIHERHGCKVRLLQVEIAGTNSNRLAYILRHENLTAFGKFSAALQADEEWLAFQQNVIGSASPAGTLVSHGLAVELPGFEGPFPVTGKSVSVLTQLRANPGGMEALLGQIKTVKDIVEKNGATVSVRTMQVAGQNTGLIGAAVSYDDIEAFGKGTDAVIATPEYGKLMAEMGAKDAPGTIVSRGLSFEIPI